ncbi:MAG: DUF3786 domain-containing protein [Deltaproteobacteria bacterium]|nr:DUF3786 domain-containing protein [Deltaproteobacteria bacterium]
MPADPNEKSGYEKIYDWVVESLAGVDLAANAGPLGLKAHPSGGVVVPMFGREYLVDSGGARPLDGQHASYNHLSLAAHYARSSGRSEPSYNFVKLNSMSGILAGGSFGSFNRDAISKPLSRRFGEDLPALEEAVEKIGGRPDPSSSGPVHGYLFEAFPRVPLKLVFEEGDDEFDPDFMILYDRSGLDYMEFEALAFLGGVLLQELVRAAPPLEGAGEGKEGRPPGSAS